MFNTPSCVPSVEIMNQLNKNKADAQKVTDAAELALQLTAEEIALNLLKAITDYQTALPDDKDVALSLVQFGTNTIIFVDNIWHIGYNLVVFHGADTSGNQSELIQHVSQISFLLTSFPKSEPDMPKRQIGFGNQ